MGILPFPLPYPVASQGVSVLITGDILKHLPCVAQPIGEVARSDGGVRKMKFLPFNRIPCRIP